MELDEFRARARALLAQGIAPQDAVWDAHSLFDGDPLRLDAPPVQVPALFGELCETVLMHGDPATPAFLYRLLWRLLHEPSLRRDPLDADILVAQRKAAAVRRDIHKMRAFLRFRDTGSVHVAWYEPDHRIVRANAPWFRRRFAQMRWAILSPECSVEWDGEALAYGPAARREEAPPPDAGEALWLTYYKSIFNPARLKLAMMQKEMPRRYWKNLPEAALIAPLAAAAAQRTGRMIEADAPAPSRRIPIFASADAPPLEGMGALDAATQACRACPIGAHATQAVTGRGPLGAALMLVGEQPGDQEDLRGEPFVGPAGQLLHEALRQAGLSPEEVFLTNAVRHFKFEPRGKRRIHKTASQREAAACAHWLESEIALVQPGKLVALGATAARSLLGRPVAVMSERGQWHARPDGRRVFVTWHPSALLRMQDPARGKAMAQLVGDLEAACT